jgi:hypothetical protein
MKNPASTKNAEEADIYLMTSIGFDMAGQFFIIQGIIAQRVDVKHVIKKDASRYCLNSDIRSNHLSFLCVSVVSM